MNMNNKLRTCGRVFVYKGFTPNLYKWLPNCQQSNISTDKAMLNSNNTSPYFCTAIVGSNGQDWTTGYVYDLFIVDNQQERLAYVECGYVE